MDCVLYNQKTERQCVQPAQKAGTCCFICLQSGHYNFASRKGPVTAPFGLFSPWFLIITIIILRIMIGLVQVKSTSYRVFCICYSI
jgi:hypothetical protein